MSPSVQNVHDVVPARLSFLTIYNPFLSHNDDDVEEQILYYYSWKEKEKSAVKAPSGVGNNEAHNEARSERLRQVGLAQGMVNFAKFVIVTYLDHTKALRRHIELSPKAKS